MVESLGITPPYPTQGLFELVSENSYPYSRKSDLDRSSKKWVVSQGNLFLTGVRSSEVLIGRMNHLHSFEFNASLSKNQPFDFPNLKPKFAQPACPVPCQVQGLLHPGGSPVASITFTKVRSMARSYGYNISDWVDSRGKDRV